MSRKIKGIRNIHVSMHWYWKKSFSIYLCIKRRIHRHHQQRLKRTREEMQTTVENRKKATTDFPRSALKRKNIIEEGRGLKLKSEDGTRKHICKGTKNDEGQSGTICNANSGKGNVNSHIGK
jgi:hypothetical protein